MTTVKRCSRNGREQGEVLGINPGDGTLMVEWDNCGGSTYIESYTEYLFEKWRNQPNYNCIKCKHRLEALVGKCQGVFESLEEE